VSIPRPSRRRPMVASVAAPLACRPGSARKGCPAARGAIVAAAAALISACGTEGSGDAGGGAAASVTVVTLKAEPVTLTRELSGRTSAFLVAEVRPQVSGIVEQRLFTEGGYVKAGQPLYQLDDAIYRAQYHSAQASLHKAQAALEAAALTARRFRELVRTHAVSMQDNETATAAEHQAQADVAATQAAVDASRVSLAYARIVAPISGRIGKSTVTQGALVTAGQGMALATIQQLDPIYVEVNQSSSDWLSLKQWIDAGRVRSEGAGASARIVLGNGSAYPHEGKLQFTDVTVDPATGNLLLRIIVPNPNMVLLPGMYVRAVLNEGVLAAGVLVPQQGVTRDPKGNASAMVVGKDGKVELRAVRVARTIGDQWLVEDGLGGGERVIVEGVQKVTPGMTVQTVEKSTAEVAGTDPDVLRPAS
jgi:membrane fusion protein, multidrug efflux system